MGQCLIEIFPKQMYFNSTLTDSSKLLKPLLVFSFIMSAIICGLTRIIQYKNHAIDVYLGFLLGGAIAVYLVSSSPFHNLSPKTLTFPVASVFLILSLNVEIEREMHCKSHIIRL